ncbi:MAG TPA: glycoside hydrolase family 38 C-terminal domain-containing protein [Bryobacteraceae bacterium]|jgi:alpha-mannosidase|nr:glycoside hydrolase family 38 C-terminal domain-containing protein [Bryobacteraceae bacterium]
MIRFFPIFLFLLLACVLGHNQAGAQTPEKPDLTKQPTLYVVGYAHLDTEWRWEYPQVINEYIRKTMEDNFKLFEKYPHYVFNFSGANRYRFMKEYFPADFARVKSYVASGQWFPAGSSMEEGDVNAPSAEAIIRQILYGNDWFRKEFGKASAEYMLPDCFGFPASLPTILAHSGVKGFSTQKLTWGSSADAGGPDSREKTPEGTPFDVGVWVGPDGESVLAGLNPGSYSGDIETDLSKPLPPAKPIADLQKLENDRQLLRERLQKQRPSGQSPDETEIQEYFSLNNQVEALTKMQADQEQERYQRDWAARVEHNGEVSGLYTDYHYYGTGDTGGAPREESVKRLEAIVTQGTASLPPEGYVSMGRRATHPDWPAVKVGDGPVRVISSRADQMFLDISPSEAAGLPRYSGEMELTNHSAGSLTSQAYQKRWLRKEELLADAAEKSSIAAEWLGARPYPLERLNDAWTLVMGGHFHDLAAGTATPKSYEFAWNDDVIAMNQFAGVLSNATEAIAAGLATDTNGVPVVVFNPLNIPREDIVEAEVNFPDGVPNSVRVTSADGSEVPAQISNGKVLFVARAPSVGYAVYDVQPVSGQAQSDLHISENSLENQFYRVRLNANGDVESIFDKVAGKELLSAPARLAISYDNPQQWPAWNMDWDQEQAAPKTYVGGPAKIRIVENGPARVALQVARGTAGSKFVQTISLSAGDGGKRVEFKNVIDWNTRESNLKAAFPLTASNRMATYNWDIGTIERPTAEPKKFEVPSHQWVDLTDASGEYGATILTDCKNGSDKPTDNTVRLTLIRTPGVRGGFPDQATQDIGHHEFIYGIAGHVRGWRDAQTDWQAERLNDPLIAFQTSRHAGALGREFSLLKVSNPRIRVMALKKAEHGDEVIVRLVELDGKPQPQVRVWFAAPVTSAREVNGQEQPVGAATVVDGALLTSFGAYQPRTFAVKLGTAQASIPGVHSAAVELRYDIATATNDGAPSKSGFDGKGNALPAEMLPSEITFDDVQFHLAKAGTGVANAVAANGQTIELPSGNYNRLYLLAASAEGDRKATFEVGKKPVDLNIQDWSGFIGQWDDRQWIAKDVEMPARGMRPARTQHDEYAEMTGIRPGYIKRANLAWYCSHHHNAAGENVPYAYSYLFAYAIDLPSGAKTISLPRDNKIRVLAISVADENPAVRPVEALYDTLGRSEPGSAVPVQ